MTLLNLQVADFFTFGHKKNCFPMFSYLLIASHGLSNNSAYCVNSLSNKALTDQSGPVYPNCFIVLNCYDGMQRFITVDQLHQESTEKCDHSNESY